MPLTTYLNHVRTLCPLLSEDEIAIFAQGLCVQTLSPKQSLLASGEIPQKVYYIVKGLIKAVYTNDEGEQVNVNFFREGMAVVDYQALRTQSPSRYDFIAIEPCVLIAVPFSHLEQCCLQMPQFERLYRLSLEQALFAYVRRTERFLITKAEQRYLDFMHAEPELFKRLSVSDLSSYLGIQRQSLTRIRKQLLVK
ncbi:MULTISPECIES: Crp/Fnr family transcriptional regulator [Glaesserella]|uniref:Crp/Fnr family transcriptional regulator n=1 Tax=Glaesserella australis TaxID=2094024 RepID=A0A328C0V2_9PAST|nr:MULTISPECIES: Crp/Fnr family transcriptional regulator [Glaesserella]AUI66868.1 hypothetical protein CJD39_09900 [Glaesserella sp. 15-184]RAL19919.1 Crp/Fnr family transcriptional regulator [Glaesserella australis]